MYGKIKEHLQNELAQIKEAGLYKTERIIESPQRAEIMVAGKPVLNFCANNYLGLSDNQRLIDAAKKAMDERGFGMSSVRFICGCQDMHKELEKAIVEIQALRKEFYKDLKLVGDNESFNVELEKALRLEDFLELGELMARDALNREESCGGHFRSEHQTEDGEALRHDDKFAYAAVWEYKGMDNAPEMTIEQLDYEFVHRAQRNYKD